MAETKSRRNGNETRKPRAKADPPRDDEPLPESELPETVVEEPDPTPVAVATDEPVPTPEPAEPGREGDRAEAGFDAETHSRYEQIKHGNTFITELQQMSMAQLLKTAKTEGLNQEEYVGLKKQDLIFRILKERVKQNGL